jgi:serine/threonine protein kinase
MIPHRIGKYLVLRKIASGGMAEVYLCRLSGEGGFRKTVAVKVIHSRFSEERHFRDLFIREARIAASLVHPNLIQVFDFGKEGDSYYLAMEYVGGWNLAQAISQARLYAVPVPLPIWRYWMEGILAGVGHLHSRGIVHGDISPSNVLLSRGGAVKITDFGIARRAPYEGDPGKGWEGKFAYMSPERARGENPSPGSDLFAAAVVSAELILLKRLLGGETAETILDRLREYDLESVDLGGLPPSVAGSIRKGLSTAREERYGNAGEFSRAICVSVPSSAGRADLETFWDDLFPKDSGEEETVHPAQIPGKGSEMLGERREGYGKRRDRLVMAGALAGLTALSVAGWAVWKRSVPTPSSPGLPSVAPGQGSRQSLPIPSGVRTTGESKELSPPSQEESTGYRREEPGSVGRDGPSRTVLIETDPAGVSVHLDDGTHLGRTPIRLDIASLPGKKILFRSEGYAGKSVHVDVLAGYRTFRLEMERQLGTIEFIQAIPWAKVYDGDRYIGITPIREWKLPVGLHRLRFVNEPLGVEVYQDVKILPGSNPRIIVPLVQKRSPDGTDSYSR